MPQWGYGKQGVAVGVGILGEGGPKGELTSHKVLDKDGLSTDVKERADSRPAQGLLMSENS